MARKTKVGIRDIAEEAGVSIGTVSKILNNKFDGVRIGEETRQRVIDTAERLGYQANPFASALRSNRTGVIGAVTVKVGSGFMGELQQQVQLAAEQQDIELLVGMMKRGDDGVEAQLSMLQGQLFDGFLLLGDMPNYRDIARKLRRANKPHVSVAAGINIEAPMVHTDEEHGIKMLTDYLVELGHQKIAFMGSPAWPLIQDRKRIFEMVLHTHGLSLPSRYISTMDNLPYDLNLGADERFHRAAITYSKRLLEQSDPPTAIFCATDHLGVGAIKGASQLGLRVPEDVSIVGFGGRYLGVTCQPELTTIRRPVEKVAAAAINLLLTLIDSPDDVTLHKRVLIEPELIIRDSCASIRRVN